MPSFYVDAIMFGLDGTLLDSTPGVTSAWKVFGQDYHFDGVAAGRISSITDAHGVQLVDSLKKWCGIDEPQVIEVETIRFEDEVIRGGPVSLPGAAKLLSQVTSGGTDERPGWVVVTSATKWFASASIKQAAIPIPANLISFSLNDGKISQPEPYVAAAAKCLANPSSCLVIEDTPQGIAGGKAAGAKTLAVCTSFSHDAIAKSDPDFIVHDLTSVSVVWEGDRLLVSLSD